MHHDHYANPRKTTSLRRLGAVDIAALKAAVLDIPEAVWEAENADKPNRFGSLERTQHIVFRFLHGDRDWRDSYDRPLWSEWRHLLAPVMYAAVMPYGYTDIGFPRVMLARMAPGGIIRPHRDANAAAKWPHKIHVPLLTNPQVGFRIHDTVHHLPEGEAVEVDNMAVHAVRNDGAGERIHLIFEAYDRQQPEPEWLARVIATA